MSKTTVPTVTVTITGEPPIPVVPAAGRLTVPTVAVTVAGDDQTVNVDPPS
jgi:hypothetical protein